MKPWEAYTTNLSYVRIGEIRTRMEMEINDTPLKHEERKHRLSLVHDEARAEWQKTNEAYQADDRRLEQEFWKDCRAELKYSDLLTEAGCNVLEARAYRDGHSGGYSEIYAELSGLSELVERLKNHWKEKA